MSDPWVVAFLICGLVYLIAWYMGIKNGYQRALNDVVQAYLDEPINECREALNRGNNAYLLVTRVHLGLFGQPGCEIQLVGTEHDRNDD